MNAEGLLAHYHRIADAPGAIARLRRFILDLAVRGKLVAQDPRDEPAAGLLARIEKEKMRLIEAGGIRKPKVLSKVARHDIPADEDVLGWTWVRLGMVCTLITKGSTPTSYGHAYTTEGVNFVKVESIRDGLLLPENITSFISSETNAFLARSRLFVGDILFSIAGSIGTCALVTGRIIPANTNQALAIIRGTQIAFDPEFLLVSLKSSVAKSVLDRARGGAMNNVSLDDVQNVVLPLPPLAEQHRIVAKVDELMALCDQLEAARAKREATRDRLSASSLARLNEPDPETFHDDARFALNALPALATRPDQIKRLRQTILNLAVRGKLVPQDPMDEPASDLLKRIAAGKTERKLKTGDPRIKAAPDPNPNALSMPLPNGWAIQSFENLFLFIDYRGNTPPKTAHGIPLITAKNIRMGRLNREPREYISEKTFKTWMTRGLPEIGDLFFTTEAPLANICLNDIEEPFALAQRAICFQPYSKVNTRFFMFALMSDLMQCLIDSHATGMTAKGIKAANLKPLPVPVPPLNEQHRIVAKVDELMALCDQLEASLTNTATIRRRLLDALLAEALAPAAHAEIAA